MVLDHLQHGDNPGFVDHMQQGGLTGLWWCSMEEVPGLLYVIEGMVLSVIGKSFLYSVMPFKGEVFFALAYCLVLCLHIVCAFCLYLSNPLRMLSLGIQEPMGFFVVSRGNTNTLPNTLNWDNKVCVLVKEFIPETLEFKNNPGGRAFPEAVLMKVLFNITKCFWNGAINSTPSRNF